MWQELVHMETWAMAARATSQSCETDFDPHLSIENANEPRCQEFYWRGDMAPTQQLSAQQVYSREAIVFAIRYYQFHSYDFP